MTTLGSTAHTAVVSGSV